MKRFLLILAIACIAPVSLGATEPLRWNSFEVGGGVVVEPFYTQYFGFVMSGAYRHHFGNHFSAGVNVETDFSEYATVMAYGDCRFRSREKVFSPFIGIGVGPNWLARKGDYEGVWGSVRFGLIYTRKAFLHGNETKQMECAVQKPLLVRSFQGDPAVFFL